MKFVYVISMAESGRIVGVYPNEDAARTALPVQWGSDIHPPPPDVDVYWASYPHNTYLMTKVPIEEF